MTSCVYTSGRIVQCGKRRVVNHKQIDRKGRQKPPAGRLRAGGGWTGTFGGEGGAARGAPGSAEAAGCWKPRLHTRGHETVLSKVSHS